MTDLNPKPEWSAVRQLEQTDRAIAGPGGVMNAQAQALLNRTEFLNNEKASHDQVMHIEKKVSAKADPEYVDQKVAAISNGRVGSYTTYEKAIADQDKWPSNCSINITNDPDDLKNGEYNWDGIILSKSEYDPLQRAKKYTDERLPIAINPTTYPIAVDQNGNCPIWIENGEIGITQLTLKSIEKVSNQLGVGSSLAESIIPIVVDQSGNCPIWIENGEIGITQLTLKSIEKVSNQLGVGSSLAESIIPIVVDQNGNCPIWIENGMINFAAMHPDAIKKNLVNPKQQSNNVTNAAYPIVSDGASLRQWKAKASNLKSGIEQQLRVVLTGDSWTEHNTISKELMDMLRAEYGEAGGGWINIGAERNMLDSVQIEYSSGWVVNDLNVISASFPHGCAPDGFTRTSSTTGASITLSNLEKGDTFTAFFGKTDGVFTYSLNNATEIEVLAETEKLEIDLTEKSSITFKVKSGEVVFFGFHLRQKSGFGIEFNRLGNGGSTGQDYLKISPQSQSKFSDFFSPDVLIIILGTNDYRLGHSVENYKLGISAIIDGFRSSNPNCGVILIAPAKSNAKTLIELSKYRDAIYGLATEKQCEFYNMHDDWGEYKDERNVKQWADSLHISKAGAYRLSQILFKNFLEI